MLIFNGVLLERFWRSMRSIIPSSDDGYGFGHVATSVSLPVLSIYRSCKLHPATPVSL